MLQRENYILTEFTRLTGRHLQPLMKRCDDVRWQTMIKSSCCLYYGAEFNSPLWMTTPIRTDDLNDAASQTLDFNVVKDFFLKIFYCFIKICFRKSHLFMKGRKKSCTFLFTNRSHPRNTAVGREGEGGKAGMHHRKENHNSCFNVWPYKPGV